MLMLMNIISDHLSDLWWCSMGVEKHCVLCDALFRKFTLRLHSSPNPDNQGIMNIISPKLGLMTGIVVQIDVNESH